MAGTPLRLAFFGTPLYAVPTLERLLAGRHPVVAAVSQPDRPRGRGRVLSPSPVSELALREGIPLLRPERVGTPESAEELSAHAPDLGVVVAFGQFMPKRIRELPGLGYCINGHASLLPRYRGAAPIARAVLAGDRVTGVSVMRVEREMDAGPVALVRELEVLPDETAGELETRMAALTAEAIAEAVELVADGAIVWTPQDDAAATLAPKLSREEARIDWDAACGAIVNRVRAFAPAPGAFTELGDETLRILAARAEPASVEATPGTVRRGSDGLRIAARDGWIVPLRVQRAGGRAMDVEAFLRGRDVPDGARLGPGTATATR